MLIRSAYFTREVNPTDLEERKRVALLQISHAIYTLKLHAQGKIPVKESGQVIESYDAIVNILSRLHTALAFYCGYNLTEIDTVMIGTTQSLLQRQADAKDVYPIQVRNLLDTLKRNEDLTDADFEFLDLIQVLLAHSLD